MPNTFQALLNRFVFGHDVQSAIEALRFATYSFPSSFAPFDYYPGRLAVEGPIAEPVIASSRGAAMKSNAGPTGSGPSARSSPTAAAVCWR
jgi:hypothetical protein